MQRRANFHPRPLVVLAAVVLAVSAGLAWSQPAFRGGGTTSSSGARATGPAASGGLTAPTRAPAGTGLVGGTATPGTTTTGSAPSPAATGIAGVGAPTVTGSPFPAGIPSPSPFPAGLPGTVPLSAGTGVGTTAGAAGTATPTVGPDMTGVAANGGVNPAASGTTGTAGTTGVGTDFRTRAATVGGVDADSSASNTAVLGGSGVGAATPGSPFAPAPTTALQVLQSFQAADVNRDGGVTRSEAQRLALPQVFEELDGNKDGVLSRGEYEDAFRR